MISFIKCYSRRVHVTSNKILRNITYRCLSKNAEQHCSNGKVDSVSNQNINSDYFGIESEEGVINVEAQKHSFPEINRRRSLKEKFHNTAFGVVRYDSENKLKYHGQYNSRSDFCFPYKSTDIAEVKNREKENQFEEEFDAFTPHSKTGNDNDTDIFTKTTKDASYIDQCYFEDTVLKNSDVNDVKQSEISELSLIDQEYFKSLDDSINLSSETKISSEKILEDGYSHEKYIDKFSLTNTSSADDLNFFDQTYFSNNINSKSEVSIDKEAFISSLSDVSPNERQSTASDIEQCIITEKSEMNITNLKESVYLDKNNSENLIDNKKESFSNEVKAYFNQDSTNISSVDRNLNDNQNEFLKGFISASEPIEGSNPKNTFSEKIAEEEFNSENQTFNFHEDFSGLFSKNIHDKESKGLNKASKVNFKYPLSVEKEQKYEKTLKKFLPSATMNSDISSNVDMEVIDSFSKKNNHSLTDLKESKQDNAPLAHDFVEDLRKEQKSSLPNLSKRRVTSEEKVDSKGFRILKNQVQDLSNFTQAEILHILKQNIVYSDDDLLVLNKPYSLVMHESETTRNPCLSMVLDNLAKELDKKTPNPKLFTVHRLDKETTGCLLLARNETMAQHLKHLFAERKLIKKYWIITIRVPDPTEGVIDMPISEGSVDNRKRMVLSPNLPKDLPYKNHTRGGRPAITSYKVISVSGNAALVEATPITGIKHQIRVHFGFGLGCPILGDHKYSHLDKLVPQKLPSDMLQRLHVRQSKVRHIPMHIHAKCLIIPSYFERRDLVVHIPLPVHMKENLKRLRFRKKN